MTPAPPWPPTVPNYQLVRMVGRGAYGEVWLGRHRLTGFWRALKLVPGTGERPGHAAAKELLGLRRYLARIRPGEPHHLTVLEVGETPDAAALYCVMELADDAEAGEFPGADLYVPRTLREVLRRRGRLSPPEAAQVGHDLSEALAGLHAQGLLHRDIKPGNVLYAGGRPKFGDLGLVTTELSARSFVGTEGYVPPEGPGSVQADLYALGKVLYETATGFDRNEFPRLPGDFDQGEGAALFRELNGIWTRACHNQPARRYRTAEELLQALRLALAGESPAARDRWLQRWRRTRRLALALVPALLITAALAWQETRRAKAKSFELYRAQLARAGAEIDRGRLGRAREELARAAREGGQTLEIQTLLRQARGDAVATHAGAGTKVVKICFSPDGRRFAAQHDDSKTTVCSVSPIGELTRLAVVSEITYLAGFLGNDRLAGTARGLDASIRPLTVWEATTGRKTSLVLGGAYRVAGTLAAAGTVIFRGRSNRTNCWRWSPGLDVPQPWFQAPATGNDAVFLDDLDLAPNGPVLLRKWGKGAGDTRCEQLQFVFPNGRFVVHEQPGSISTAAVAPDGRFAAYAEPTTGSLVLGRVDETFATLATNLLPETFALAFSPDGLTPATQLNTLATAGEDETVRLHRVPGLEVTARLSGPERAVSALAWSPDGRWLVAGDKAGKLYLLRPDFASRPLDHGVADGFLRAGASVGLVANADESLVAATRSTNSLMLVRPDPFTLQAELPGARTPLGFSADGQCLWALTAAGDLVALMLPDGEITAYGPALGETLGGAEFGLLAPGRTRLLVYAGRSYAVWDVSSPTGPRRLAEHTLPVRHLPSIQQAAADGFIDLAFTADGSRALLCTRIDAVDLALDATARQPAVVALDEEGGRDLPEVYSACHEPVSGDWLLGADGGQILRWRRGLPAPLLEAENLTGSYCLQALPNDDRVVAAGGNGRIVIARASDLTQLVWFQHHGLRAEGGEHTIRRLLPLARTGAFLTLTESGRLVRW